MQSLKSQYRSTIFEFIFNRMHQLTELRAIAANTPAGVAGVDLGMSPTILDVANIIHLCWHRFPRSTIINCFRKASILPERHHDDLVRLGLDGTFGPTAQHMSHMSVDEICSANAHRLEVSSARLKAEMEAWLNLESNVEFIREAVEYEGRSLLPSQALQPPAANPPVPGRSRKRKRTDADSVPSTPSTFRKVIRV